MQDVLEDLARVLRMSAVDLTLLDSAGRCARGDVLEHALDNFRDGARSKGGGRDGKHYCNSRNMPGTCTYVVRFRNKNKK